MPRFQQPDLPQAPQRDHLRALIAAPTLTRRLYNADARDGLESRAVQVLLAIALLPDPAVGEIAEELALPHRKVVELLRKLREQGLAASRPDPDDSRRQLQSLTTDGEDHVRAFAAASTQLLGGTPAE
jgi:DNA-binding MarR family transcriptional regulator